MSLVAPQHVEPSWTRDQTHVPCRQILNHWTTREVQESLFLMKEYIFLITDKRTTTKWKGQNELGVNIAMQKISLVYKELLQIDKKKTNHCKENLTKDVNICQRENLNCQQTEKEPQFHKWSGCCSHVFRETNSLWRTMQIVECSLLHRWAQGRVSS